MKHNTKRAILSAAGVLISAGNALAAGGLATGNLTAANTGDVVNGKIFKFLTKLYYAKLKRGLCFNFPVWQSPSFLQAVIP